MTTTETPEKEAETPVLVMCLGIACESGFQINADGYEPGYVHFQPGVPKKLRKWEADWLIAQDKSRFEIVKPGKSEKSEEKTTNTTTETASDDKAAKVKDRAAKAAATRAANKAAKEAARAGK